MMPSMDELRREETMKRTGDVEPDEDPESGMIIFCFYLSVSALLPLEL